MYKQTKPMFEGMESITVQRLSDNAFIPFDQANTDYQNFKKQINADEAQLENADGVLMSADEAKEYVKSLP